MLGLEGLHRRLMDGGRGDPFDRHVFASAIVAGLGEEDRSLTEALGLSPSALGTVLGWYFPTAWRILPARTRGIDAGVDALEEPDLRALLLDHRTAGTICEAWLAAIIARRSLAANHLWQDLGLFSRDELSRLMERHFRALKRRNSRDMKWKKFFYRELCARDGVAICKSPNCSVCADVALCFGPEAGEPLSAVRSALSDVRQSQHVG